MRILMPRLAPVVTKLTANAPGETDGWSRVAPGYMGDLAGYLSDLKGLTSLTQLTLLRCNATTDFSFLPALTNLTGLHLAAEPKKPPVRLPLSAVPPLESLRLHRVTLDAPAIAGALAGRLSRLELLGPACWAGSLPAGAPLPLALTHAVLGDDPRPDAQRAAAAADTQALISPVAHAASLRFLRVAGTCRHAHGAADIPPPDWPHLQRLDLACFCALPALLPLPSLRAIRASLCEACRAGANAHRDAQLSAAWGAMACLPLLETLEVRGVLDPAELGDGELASKPLSPALEPLERLRAVLVVDYATEGTFGLRAAALRTLAVENRDPKGGPRPLDATLLKCTKLRRLDAWWPGARLPRGGGDGSVSRDMLELLGPSLEWGAFRPVNYVEPPDHFMPA
ncbi:unnamed protein product [Pedinophyceae sp. YPF-701]|nr:unnamed protein product [Pedinophyceae sp. YPF-701]